MSDNAERAISKDRLLDDTHADVDVQLGYFTKDQQTIRFSLMKEQGVWKIRTGKILTGNAVVAHQNAGNLASTKNITDGTEFINAKSIQSLLRSAMGGDFESFLDSAQIADDLQARGSERFAFGGVNHMRTVLEFFTFVNLSTGRCVAGYLKDDDVQIYGAHSQSELPTQVQQWLRDLQNRRGGNEPLKVKFKAATPLRPIQASGTAKLRAPTSNSWTGTYKRDADRFNKGTLQAHLLDGNKLDFSLFAVNGGNTGEAGGTASIRGNDAVYQDDLGRILFHLNKKQVSVQQKDKDVGPLWLRRHARRHIHENG